jgi:truncated hemoglobin YjbI
MTLNQQELQNLRHLIGSHMTMERKCNFYAEQSQDPQCRQIFSQAAKSSSQTYQKLTSFLG